MIHERPVVSQMLEGVPDLCLDAGSSQGYKANTGADADATPTIHSPLTPMPFLHEAVQRSLARGSNSPWIRSLCDEHAPAAPRAARSVAAEGVSRDDRHTATRAEGGVVG
jgi:hypothetical protein